MFWAYSRTESRISETLASGLLIRCRHDLHRLAVGSQSQRRNVRLNWAFKHEAVGINMLGASWIFGNTLNGATLEPNDSWDRAHIQSILELDPRAAQRDL